MVLVVNYSGSFKRRSFNFYMSFYVYLYVLSFFPGDRGKIKAVAKELSVDCLDTGGHTPLMYAVMGRQPKVSGWAWLVLKIAPN